MKLEVGMYVRTKYHGILRYGDRFLFNDEIIKASHNIIDLIEVGDYVNGLLIVDKFYDYANKEMVFETDRCKFRDFKDIKSIVTKEQFESMQYSLEV